MTIERATLWYAHDPMCSYCYGFAPTWQQVREQLPAGIDVRYVLGGLAPDNDEPMAAEMIDYLQKTWRIIEQRYGVKFNHDYWALNQPRRSTYPSCRAVLVAKAHGLEEPMIKALQAAYYQQAKNPSDVPVLVEAAISIGLSESDFTAELHSAEIEQALQNDMAAAAQLGLNQYPSLLLSYAEYTESVAIHYTDVEQQLTAISDTHARLLNDG